MRNYLRKARMFLIVVTIMVLPAIAQEKGPCQRAEEYAPREPGMNVEAAALRVQRVFGRAIIEGENTVITGDKVTPACMSLFTEDSHRFVASVALDNRGNFNFGTVRPGNYRLVARSPGLCTGNTKVQVTASRVGRGKNGILVHFRIHNVDDCTFADYDKPVAQSLCCSNSASFNWINIHSLLMFICGRSSMLEYRKNRRVSQTETLIE
jgi:hypothetical protein